MGSVLVNSCVLLLFCQTWLIDALTVRPYILADLTNGVTAVVSEEIREQTALLEAAVENQILVNEECTALEQQSGCPGWSAANAAVERLTAATQWIKAAKTNGNIEITQMLYEITDYDLATGGFRNTRVFIDMFGTSYTFTISEPVDLLNKVETANLIATYVISAARNA